MPSVRYGDRSVGVQPGETLLVALLRAGVTIPFSCKSGVCHTCLSRCLSGQVPEKAQRSLPDHWAQQGYFLPCKCIPTQDMVVVPADKPAAPMPAAVAPTQALMVELPYPEPDPALWAELGDGVVVRQVLESFYDSVYADAQLAPFFDRVTKDHVIGKQYSFLKQCLTGAKVFMGDRPRHAHHWMIISDALFDHRQALMRRALLEHGLSARQIQRWTRVEEHFRADMVKSQARPRRMGDVDIVAQGFATETLSEATLCDHCGAEIPAGTTVVYHQRLGHVSCHHCADPLHVARHEAALAVEP